MAAVDPGQAGAIPGPGNTRSLDDAGPSSHQPPPFQGPLTPKPSPIQKAVAEAKAALAKSAGEPTTTQEDSLTAAAEGTGLSRATTDAIAHARSLRAAGRSDDEIRAQLRAYSVSDPAIDAALQALAALPAAETEAAPNPLLVKVDDDIDLQLEDADTAARVRESMMRAADYRQAMADVEDRLVALQYFEDALETDPVGALVPRLAQSPERVVELVKHLLALPGIEEAVQADPREPNELLAGLAQRQRQGEAQLNQVAAAREYQRRVVAAVHRAIAGSTLTGEARDMAQTDFLRDIAAHVRANGNRPIPLTTLPQLLQARAERYGLDANAVAAAFTSSAPPLPRTPRATEDQAAAVADVGARLKAASAARREVAAVPGAGAGARPAKIELQPQGVKERIAALRKAFIP